MIEKRGFGCKDIWQAICDIQWGRRGLVSSHAVTIFDEDGAPYTSTEVQHAPALNVDSSFVVTEKGIV